MIYELVSPCKGIIEDVYIQEQSYVYEWEKLMVIRDSNGDLKAVEIGVSGDILSVHVNQGDQVTPDTKLVVLKDDMLITGSD